MVAPVRDASHMQLTVAKRRVVILPVVVDIVAARSVRLVSGRWRNDAKIIGCHGTRVQWNLTIKVTHGTGQK